MQHEHEFEAAPGLPEKLPAGERILWQGAPSAWQLAVHALHVRKLAVYFSLMLGVQAVFLRADGLPLAASLGLSAALAVVALSLLGFTAWMAARTTLYTLTDRRVVMRIGIVLTLTFNLPLRQIAGASIRPQSRGFGDIALALQGDVRIAWAHLWPHARPWHLRRPQPTLRCLADAQSVSQLLQQAWQAQNVGVSLERAPAAGPSPAMLHPAAETVAG